MFENLFVLAREEGLTEAFVVEEILRHYPDTTHRYTSTLVELDEPLIQLIKDKHILVLGGY